MNTAVFKGLRYIFSKAGVGKQTRKRGKTELEVRKWFPPPNVRLVLYYFLQQTPPPEVEVQVDTTIDEDVQAEGNEINLILYNYCTIK